MKMSKRAAEVFQGILDMLPKFMDGSGDGYVGFEEAFLHFLPQLLYAKMILEETHDLKTPITSKILEDLFSIVYVFWGDEDQNNFWEEMNKYLRKIASSKTKSIKKHRIDNVTNE